MASIKDIAREAGVSIGTVDRVLHHRGRVSEETTAKIKEIMKQLDYKPNHVAQGLAVNKKKLNLGFLIFDSEKNPFFSDVQKAAKKRADKLKQYGVHVDFGVIKHDANGDAKLSEETKNAILEADGIVSIGFASGAIMDLLKQMMDKNVPVVFYNSRLTDWNYFAFVGCNYVDSGRLAAGLAARIGGEDARIGIFSQGVDSLVKIDSYEERMEGFRQEIAERYPNMKIVVTSSIEDDNVRNEKTVEEIIRKYTDINIAYIVNPGDYEICEEIYRADKEHKIKIITNDLVGRQIQMVRKEIIAATICQEPEKQGDKPLDILFQYLAYGVKPKKRDVYTKLSIHIAQNI